MNQFKRMLRRIRRKLGFSSRRSSDEYDGWQRHTRSRRPAGQMQLGLYIAFGVLVAAVVILLVIFIIKKASGSFGPDSWTPPVSSSDSQSELVVEEIPTILPESEDAGQTYVDETLFIGDSNTYRMMVYGFTSLSNDIGIDSMGIQMVPDTPCVYFEGYNDPVTIPEAVAILQPRRIVLTFGTNNTVGWSTETFINSYRTALEAINEAYPYADIIINAIPPVHQYHDNSDITIETIDKYNLALVDLAEEMGFKFLNSTEVLKDEETGYAKWDYTLADGIHLNKDAMTALFDYFRTHSYVTEDDRPTPLETIPARDEIPPDLVTTDPPAEHTENPDASSQGVEVVFTVSSGAAGYLTGSTDQTVLPGESCSTVIAHPNAGYEFVRWQSTSGWIPNRTQTGIVFTVPENAEAGTIRVTAVFRAQTATTPSTTPVPNTGTTTPTPGTGTTTPTPG
ncbi:MAG TPA: hypothetical protein H9896_06395, partial [Candidatus Pygmaiobacter gallistercoris]|nr:hypothetical protein [Candidatus Pygmaiobacter gallistercoris]